MAWCCSDAGEPRSEVGEAATSWHEPRLFLSVRHSITPSSLFPLIMSNLYTVSVKEGMLSFSASQVCKQTRPQSELENVKIVNSLIALMFNRAYVLCIHAVLTPIPSFHYFLFFEIPMQII